MKSQDLKKSILQYAVQGKLVPQNPQDEPASELLKRIKTEKEQLIKDGKIKKEKPLPPITQDEIPYALQQGWEWARLGGICKLEQGAKVNNVRLPLLNARYLRYRTDKQILSDGQLVQKDSYIILVDGENSGEVFKVFEDGIMGSTFKLLSINSNTNIDFILYILKYYQDVFRYSKKGAAIPHLDKELFKNIVIGVPPLAEQKRIVEKLEEILPLVDEYGKNEEILSEMNQKLPKQIRQSILQYAVQGKLVPQNPQDEPASELLKRIKTEKEQLIKDGKIKKEKPLPPITQDEIPYALQQGWEWARLGGICKLEQGAKVNNVRLPLLNARYLRYRTDKQILSDGQLVQKDSYIILVDGENSGEVFKVFEDGIMGSTFKLLSINSNTNIDFILYILKYYQDVFRYSKKGAAIPHLDKELFKNIVIGVPPLAEQKRIVAKVDKLMQICEELEIKNNIAQKSSSELFQSILQNYYTQKESSNEIIDLKFKRAVLSAEIINELYEEKYFGSVKLEKILYLCETHLGVTLNGKYKKEAAGPYDAKSRYEVEDILKIKKWFDVQKVTNGSVEITKYLPLENCHEIKTLYNDVFAGSLSKIDKLMDLFKGKNSDFCESIATLYAVWKNRLNNNLTCSNSELIADFKMWSKSKERFYDSDLLDRILFMRRKGLTPDSNIKK